MESKFGNTVHVAENPLACQRSLSAKIRRHIVDGEWCATVFDFDTTFGTIPMIDCFHGVDGQILSIRVYLRSAPDFAGHEQGRSSTLILIDQHHC